MLSWGAMVEPVIVPPATSGLAVASMVASMVAIALGEVVGAVVVCAVGAGVALVAARDAQPLTVTPTARMSSGIRIHFFN